MGIDRLPHERAEHSCSQPGKRAQRVDRRRALGRHGEQLAEAHLARLGFRTLDRNVRTRAGEIDLIAFDGETLVFAEVKTLCIRAPTTSPGADQQPLQFLRHRQRARLRSLAVAWLSDQSRVRPSARTIRFDAIGVTVDAADRLLHLEHIEGAW